MVTTNGGFVNSARLCNATEARKDRFERLLQLGSVIPLAVGPLAWLTERPAVKVYASFGKRRLTEHIERSRHERRFAFDLDSSQWCSLWRLPFFYFNATSTRSPGEITASHQPILRCRSHSTSIGRPATRIKGRFTANTLIEVCTLSRTKKESTLGRDQTWVTAAPTAESSTGPAGSVDDRTISKRCALPSSNSSIGSRIVPASGVPSTAKFSTNGPAPETAMSHRELRNR